MIYEALLFVYRSMIRSLRQQVTCLSVILSKSYFHLTCAMLVCALRIHLALIVRIGAI